MHASEGRRRMSARGIHVRYRPRGANAPGTDGFHSLCATPEDRKGYTTALSHASPPLPPHEHPVHVSQNTSDLRQRFRT